MFGVREHPDGHLAHCRAHEVESCGDVLAEQHEVEARGAVDELVQATHYFEALKRIRALFPVEQAILAGAGTVSPFEAA